MQRLYDMLVEYRMDGENESRYEKFKAENNSDLLERFQIEHEGEKLKIIRLFKMI